MTFTGDRVDAATAAEWGMVSRVVGPDALLDEARTLAERITKNPAEALRMAKRLLQESRTSLWNRSSAWPRRCNPWPISRPSTPSGWRSGAPADDTT